MADIGYPFDPTGKASTNYILNEQHIVTEANYRDYFFIVPNFAPFFIDDLIIKHHNLNDVRTLVEGVDYYLALNYLGATRSIGQPIYGAISLNSLINIGVISISYRTLGGPWCADIHHVLEHLAEREYNPRLVAWDQVTNVQETFPPINHQQDFESLLGYEDLIQAIVNLSTTIAEAPNQSPIIKHLVNYDNPHRVTLEQLGYSVADLTETLTGTSTTALITPSVLIATITEYINIVNSDINDIFSKINSTTQSLIDHVRDINNPHKVNKAQVGLDNVPNLSLAHDSEVANRDKLDKFVTLKQVITLLENFEYTSPDAGAIETYILSPASNIVNEGDGLLFQVVTSNIPNYTTLFWSIAHISTNNEDFVETSGNITIVNNGASFVVQTKQDIKQEINEVFIVRLRKDSVSGPIVATSVNIGIINQELNSEFETIVVPNNLSESETATVNITATQIPDKTKAYWTLKAIDGDLNNFVTTSGSFTFNLNVGVFDITVIDNIAVLKDQTFEIEIRLDSTSGTIIDKSGLITLKSNVYQLNSFNAGNIFNPNITISAASIFTINSCYPDSCKRKFN
jgi:hypothetical protein